MTIEFAFRLRAALRDWPCLLVFAAIAMCAATDVTDHLRRGATAYERGDFVTALDEFSRAVVDTADPGLVAFDQAAALYQLERFSQALDLYRCCLEDATGARRVRALYGLGNALAQLGVRRRGPAGVRLLDQALRTYAQCLESASGLPPADVAVLRGLLADVRTNAKQVEAARDRKRGEAAPPSPPGNDPRASDPSRPDPNKPGSEDATADRPGHEGQGRDADSSAGGPGTPTGERRPGRGKLPVLLDSPNAPPLTAEQATDFLQHTVDRLRRQQAAGAPGTMPANAKDW
jgi:hypothetical protein